MANIRILEYAFIFLWLKEYLNVCISKKYFKADITIEYIVDFETFPLFYSVRQKSILVN